MGRQTKGKKGSQSSPHRVALPVAFDLLEESLMVVQLGFGHGYVGPLFHLPQPKEKKPGATSTWVV